MNTAALAVLLERLPALGQVLDKSAQRYSQLSAVRGTLALDAEEAKAIRLIGGRVSASGRVSLSALDRALNESSVGGDLLAVLRHTGRLRATRQEVSAEHGRQWALFERDMLQEAGGHGAALASRWLKDDRSYLYGKAIRARPRFVRGMRDAVRILGELPLPSPTPLAYYAAQRFGNAHTLDSDQPAGRLLLRAVRTLFYSVSDRQLDVALSPRARIERAYANIGLLLDDLSSDVLVAGIALDQPWSAEAARVYDPVRLTLHALNRTSSARTTGAATVYAVENPVVFRILHERAQGANLHVPLVCASGQPSLAVQRLVELLASSGVAIRYSGDLDVRGYAIAHWFHGRYPECVELWRMGKGDLDEAFRRAPSGPPAVSPALPNAVCALLALGTAHQETIVDLLWADISEDAQRAG